MDAVAVEAVIQASADCSDRAKAEAALQAALAAARGPRRGRESTATTAKWHVDVTVLNASPGIKSADATIHDDTGNLIAERNVSDKTTGSCLALARAVGAWAQIVLDDELTRAHDSGEPKDLPPPESQPIKTKSVRRARANNADDGDLVVEAPAEDKRTIQTIEVGTMMFMRNGVAASGGIFGASPFMTIGFSKIWVMRPSLMIGTSTSKVPPDQSRSANVTAFGGRLDLCRRLPGNYIDRRGIEFDACAGGDVIYVASDISTAVRGSVGPSMILRGELGANFGLEIRGMLGANLARAGLGPDAPYFVAAAEIGGSVRFR